VIESFDGGDGHFCDDTLKLLRNCYNDVNQCGYAKPADNLSLQKEVQAMFDPYLKAGAMAPDDIAKVSSVSYDVTYE
jgi:hypothetical protein